MHTGGEKISRYFDNFIIIIQEALSKRLTGGMYMVNQRNTKQTLLLLILSFSMLYGCSTDNNDTPPLENEITILEELKFRLNGMNQSDEVILSFTDSSQAGREVYQFILDSNEELLVSASLIDTLIFDSDAWQLIFRLNDQDEISTYAVGERILREGHSTIELNPSGYAPLAAVATITMPVPGRFVIRVLGKGPFGIEINKAFSTLAQEHNFPILGLYANHQNEIEFSYYSAAGTLLKTEPYFITTPRISNPDIQVNVNNLPADDQSIFFVSDLKLGFDHRGEVRWLWTHPAHYVFRKLQNGNLIISSNEDMIMYHTRRFYEVDMLGNIIQTFETPNYQHHEIREHPNGNFLVATNSTPIMLGNGLNQEDFIIEYSRNTGSPVRFWDFNLILDNQRLRIPGERAEDWLHNNAIYYHDETNALIISGRAQSAVASVDYETTEVNWIISDPYGWTGNLADKLLTPVDESGTPLDVSNMDFWPYGQHAALILPNGNVFMYDNGRYRNYYRNRNAPADSYSRAVEYEIDTDNMTIRKVWEFDYNQTLFTPFTGDVDYFENNGHRMISFMWGSGNTPRVFELDEYDTILFEASINIGSNYYRMEKLNLYEGID